MTEPDNSRITIEETVSGLTMRIIVPPRDTDGGERFIYLGSMLFLFIGVLMAAQGGDAVYGGGLVLAIGVSGIALSFYNRNRVWRGSDSLYHVSCTGGMVTFARNDNEQTFELAKLGRIWFTERTRNGQPSGVDLTAYYDGSETLIFDIIELNYVSDDANEFLNCIDAYLNNTADAAHAVLTGYRPDYATDTPPQAKDQRELAPAPLRLFFSSLAALPMMVYFSDLSHWPINLLIGLVVAPLFFALAASRCRSCTCRYRRPADFVTWPLLAALAGWAFKAMIDFLATSEGLPGLSGIIMPTAFLLMTGIIYRVISGCSCGARVQSR